MENDFNSYWIALYDNDYSHLYMNRRFSFFAERLLATAIQLIGGSINSISSWSFNCCLSAFCLFFIEDFARVNFNKILGNAIPSIYLFYIICDITIHNLWFFFIRSVCIQISSGLVQNWRLRHTREYMTDLFSDTIYVSVSRAPQHITVREKTCWMPGYQQISIFSEAYFVTKKIWTNDNLFRIFEIRYNVSC